MMISTLIKPNLSHRVLAIVAMVVLLTGKTAHVHQECTDCRSPESHSETETSATNIAETVSSNLTEPVQVSCPLGCDHDVAESTAGDQPTKDLPPLGHDESSCAVCDVLAAAPDHVLVMCLPEWTNLVQAAVPAQVNLPEAVEGREIRLRGPPIA